MKPQPCSFCGLPIEKSQFSSHSNQCGSRTKVCLYCNKNVLLRDYDSHEANCMINFTEKGEPQQENTKKNTEFDYKPSNYQRKDPAHYEKEDFNAKKDPFNYYKDYGTKETKGVSVSKPMKNEDYTQKNDYLESNVGYGVQKNRFEFEKEREKPASNPSYKGGNPTIPSKIENYDQKSNKFSANAPPQQLSGYDKHMYEQRKKIESNKPNQYDDKGSNNYPSNYSSNYPYNNNNYPTNPSHNYNPPNTSNTSNNYNNNNNIKVKPMNPIRPGEQYNKIKEEQTKNQEPIKKINANNLYSQQAITNNSPARNPTYNHPSTTKPVEKQIPPTSTNNANKNLNFYEKKNSFDDKKMHMKDYNKEIPDRPTNQVYKPSIPSKNYEGKSAGIPNVLIIFIVFSNRNCLFKKL